MQLISLPFIRKLLLVNAFLYLNIRLYMKNYGVDLALAFIAKNSI